MFLINNLHNFNFLQSSIIDDVLISLLTKNLVYPGKTSNLLPTKKINEKIKLLPNKNGFSKVNNIDIFWRVIDAGNYDLKVLWPDGKIGNSFPEISFNHGENLKLYKKHKGTIVLIHGWMMNGNCMLPWALKLANEGYKCICVDLRSHGKSSIRRAGYGLYESYDMSLLIDELRKNKIIDGDIHLFGISYGGAISIFTSSIRKDIKSVISIESFSNAKMAVESMVTHLIYSDGEIKPTPFDNINDFITKRFNNEILQSAIKKAGEKIGFELEEISPLSVIDKVSNPLIIHGVDDMHVKIENGRELAKYCNNGKYVEVENENHLTLPMKFDKLMPHVKSWLEK